MYVLFTFSCLSGTFRRRVSVISPIDKKFQHEIRSTQHDDDHHDAFHLFSAIITRVLPTTTLESTFFGMRCFVKRKVCKHPSPVRHFNAPLHLSVLIWQFMNIWSIWIGQSDLQDWAIIMRTVISR